ncbi:hypothetical protein [Nevskia sp.]|uniref:metallophosphoesterase family protein n=1 Tax=Nevskia sp. TaxID=1929292 RepID=UPI0025D41AEB|nr:hypothetical protein [Nevskia sp.]
MKIAQFSDLHYCEKHIQWVDDAFKFAVKTAIEMGAECAILSGDSFDAAVPLHHPAVDLLLTRVRQLADRMPVLILQGTFSHDRPGAVSVFRHLASKHPIYVAEMIRQVAYLPGRWHELADGDAVPENAELLVSCLPSINRANVQAAAPEAQTADLVGEVCAGWRGNNTLARGLGIPTVMVSHGTVNGCVTESKQAMVSPDHEFGTATLFSADTSAVMLGHIHAHQGWEDDGRRIAYAGSITKLIYGHDQPTGFLMWEVGAHKADYTLIETPARQLVDITFDGLPDPAELGRRLAACRGAYVRLRYSIDEEHRSMVDVTALREMLIAAGVADFKIEPHVNPVQRSRAEGIHLAATLQQKLIRWCELTSTDPAPLLPRLATLEAGQQPGT